MLHPVSRDDGGLIDTTAVNVASSSLKVHRSTNSKVVLLYYIMLLIINLLSVLLNSLQTPFVMILTQQLLSRIIMESLQIINGQSTRHTYTYSYMY